MCCDDAYPVMPRISALAGCERLVSEGIKAIGYREVVLFRPTGYSILVDPEEESIEEEPHEEPKEEG
ncbi:hypothetical protein Tco_0213800 [Tanacetum coccineum]